MKKKSLKKGGSSTTHSSKLSSSRYSYSNSKKISLNPISINIEASPIVAFTFTIKSKTGEQFSPEQIIQINESIKKTLNDNFK